MRAAIRSTLGMLSALVVALSIVVLSRPVPTHAMDPLPLPTVDLGTSVPLPTIGLWTPPPTIGPGSPLPTGLGTPLPTVDLVTPRPLPTIGLGTPLPTIGVGTPLPTVGLGTPLPTIVPRTSPISSGSAVPGPPRALPEDASPRASDAPLEAAGRSSNGGLPRPVDSEAPSSGEPVADAIDRLRLRDLPPLPPTLPDVGSWLVPALGAAVPALIVALLVALQLAGGAVGLGLARGALGRLAAATPAWLRR